ncbi:site-specific DNA-methyltransferase [Agrobacterium tumefaciens]|uniref:DNA-methyltransferase n=1 Tax=Agrobacterium TaxID=357 RepID=UPI00115D208E|nr:MULTISPECIES: site-specific DNA-methyltransferase [Agrobacterium]MDA5241021.1 site-specific DNA-methyltransferase [Agrobacterium sp. MAFF310724]MDA5249747.1 site-specific DNA-methyltransferase [Agrobacterium sp. MAFF210268]TRB12247.1 site-specific DNA-methyltransferase [Agrobacterium tumefaciens]
MGEKIGNGEYFMGDCLEVMKDIPDGSVDMVLCDLPYNVLKEVRWDSLIEPEQLFGHYKRICKPKAALVLTAQQPFTSTLIEYGIKYFEKYYAMVWDKGRATGFLFKDIRPMAAHEDILVFYQNRHTYIPGATMLDEPVKRKGKKAKTSGESFIGRDTLDKEYFVEAVGYPTSVVRTDPLEMAKWDWIDKGIHPTRKPVPLFQQLIQWYSKPDDVVLDNTAGSGTTALAAQSTGRKWICIEQDQHYYDVGTYLVKEYIRRYR